MTREEFSAMLINARKEKGLSRYAVSKSLQFFGMQLSRMEKAEHNYAIKTVLKYLNVIGYKLYACDKNSQQTFEQENDWITYLRNLRLKIGTQVSVNKSMNSSLGTLQSVESGRNNLTIDFFLDYAKALGLEIKLIKND